MSEYNRIDENVRFFSAVLEVAKEILASYQNAPRLCSVFSVRQRWLMMQAGFALHFGYPGEASPGLYSARFIDFVVKHDIASRNTAAAFIQELLVYRLIRRIETPNDRRTRLVEPTEDCLSYMRRRIELHLKVLDEMDGGQRLAMLTADPRMIARLQPMIAQGIIEHPTLRSCGETFDLFNGAVSGALVMDYLMTRITEIQPDAAMILTGPLSLREIRGRFNISNTHLKRLLTQAGEHGSVGWTEPAYKGEFWISRSFIEQYLTYKLRKFAVVREAADSVMRQTEMRPQAVA